MIQLRHDQPTLWSSLMAEQASDLYEPWMREADLLLEDEDLLEQILEAQGKRWRQSRRRGRKQTPAEVVLRLMLLKHVLNCSYEVLEREVRGSFVYRDFARIGTEKVPDAKTLGRLGQVVGAEVVKALHARVVALAREKKVVQGRKMRVDTTVVETNIHYPTDSSLLGDGARVITRLIERIAAAVGGLQEKVRNRMRTVKKQVVAIAISARQKGEQAQQRRKEYYRVLLRVTRQVVNQGQRVLAGVRKLSRRKQRAAARQRKQLTVILQQVRQVIRQTKERVMKGNTQAPDKLASLFEPHTEIIRKGKASKPTEFGKMVQVQEAENQIITDYQVFPERPGDAELLVPAVEEQQRRMERVPELVAADAGFYSQAGEKKLETLGVRRVSIPNRHTRSAERKKKEKSRWFKRGQKWRTGCEGRISVLKRRHGMDRCLYRGLEGMGRWVGWGVIADNLINMGRHLAQARA
jgi:IS5 family transposase